MDGFQSASIYFTYDRQTVIRRLIMPAAMMLILVVSLFICPRSGPEGVLRIIAFSVLSAYALFLMISFIRQRSTRKNSAFYMISVFLSVSLMVQGVYLLDSEVAFEMSILTTVLGAAGIFYYVMVNRTREPSMMISRNGTVSILIKGEEVFSAEFTDIRSVWNKGGGLELELSDSTVIPIPSSEFENTEEVMEHIKNQLAVVSS